MTFITPARAQTEPELEVNPEEPLGAPAGSAELHESTEVHGGEHGAFPPFDPATFGSQLFWLALCFGALYLLMSRVALPRIGTILAERDNRVAGDLARAGALKQETDAAIAAYEQALAEARQNAHAIAQKGRAEAKAEVDAHRAGIEGDLQGRLEAAETRIGEVKSRALAEVDVIAKDAADAIIEALIGVRAGEAEIASAVDAAKAERI